MRVYSPVLYKLQVFSQMWVPFHSSWWILGVYHISLSILPTLWGFLLFFHCFKFHVLKASHPHIIKCTEVYDSIMVSWATRVPNIWRKIVPLQISQWMDSKGWNHRSWLALLFLNSQVDAHLLHYGIWLLASVSLSEAAIKKVSKVNLQTKLTCRQEDLFLTFFEH